MTRTQNLSVRVGDTAELVVPVLDGDNPAATFFDAVDSTNTEVQFAIASSDSATSAQFTDADSDIAVTTDVFRDTLLTDNDFEAVGSIPGDQEVVVVTISGAVTQQLDPGEDFVYAIRLDTGSATVTVLDGTLDVEPSPPFN